MHALKQQWRRGVFVLLLAGATLQLSQAGYLLVKAELAQLFIADAWQQTLNGKKKVKPWDWADTWPVARLQMSSRIIDENLYVLAGANGSSLAFGPGHITGTTLPGGHGNIIIGGHRDTHFDFLAEIKLTDELRLQAPNGNWHHYRVDAINIRDIQTGPLLINPAAEQLQLISCYPFNALKAGGPLRYIVTANKI